MKRDDDLSKAGVENFRGVFKEIVDAIGEDGAHALIKQYGGTRLFVPLSIPDGHRLVVLLGMESAQKLCASFGGQEHFDIPLGAARKRARRNAQIYADRADGMSVPGVARKYHMSERGVRLILAARRKPESTKQKPIGKPINRSV
jgi:hypothetical protein